MKKVILATACCSINVAFADINTQVFQSHDTENMQVTQQIVSVDSVRVAATDYAGPSSRHSASSIAYNSKDGYVGLGSTASKTYLVADIAKTIKIDSDTDLSIGLAADLVDSETSLNKGITYTGGYATVDARTSFGGFVLSPRTFQYSNGNTQIGLNTKLYADVVDGMNVYINTRHFENSKPMNGDFYSPKSFGRVNLGIGFRQRVFDTMIASGFVETGVIDADSVTSRASAWRLAVERPRSDSVTFGLAVGSDTTRQAYRYDYVRLYVNFKL